MRNIVWFAFLLVCTSGVTGRYIHEQFIIPKFLKDR